MATLYELTQDFLGIEDLLYENGGELTPELETALAETRESLMAKVDSYCSIIRKFGAKKAAIDAEIKRLQSLKKAAENGEKRLKERIVYHMDAFGLDRLEGKLCRMSLRTSKSLSVDEGMILGKVDRDVEKLRKKLPSYMTVEVKISRDAIKAAEKETGMLPEGCSYASNKSLQIR